MKEARDNFHPDDFKKPTMKKRGTGVEWMPAMFVFASVFAAYVGVKWYAAALLGLGLLFGIVLMGEYIKK